ncbi:MAG: lipopolysaccharide heptosyltransferase II [Vicinamibacterales bacterium]
MTGIERLVVRAPNWLGDAVMALPAIAAVRRAFASSVLVVAAPRSVAPLFEEVTEARPDGVVVVERDWEIAQLRAANAQAVLLFPNSFHSAWNARRAGFRERWGFAGGGRSWLLTRAARRPRGHIHQTEYYRQLVRGVGIDADDLPPRLDVSAGSRAAADRLLRDRISAGQALVGFAPGAAYGHAKRWPPDRVAEVAARVVRRGGAAVFVGAAADRETGRAIESTLPPDVHAINLIGRTTLGQLVGVIARCSAFVSNDSGAMHVAAALGVPLTALFGPTDERRTAPRGPAAADVMRRDVFCRPCMLRECPIDHRCMKRIGVDDVCESVARHLGW